MTKKISNVMLIDDEEIDLKLYTRVLERSGLVENVLAFSYADEAFEFLKNNDDVMIDVIFLDINMPRMNGFEFLERVTSELTREIAHVVIMMLTTSLDPKDRERAERFDLVREFINKPLVVAHVLRAVELLEEVRG
ncbi:MAG: response regulator [Pseudomonadota bacterium]